ncbi:MAG: helix-turn-helix domain-containing protein [Pseudomonadota bacterium]
MNDAILGTQIRERRRQIGLTQVALAREIGISASYLNLIEANKRRIAGQLLQRIATALGMDAEDLDGTDERRLSQALDGIARQPAVQKFKAEINRTGEMIGRFPGWARTLAAIADSEQSAQQTARAMADRLAHDPFLGETVHHMLTRIAAIRSVAEILTDVPDIETEERNGFNQLIADEARGLTDLAGALADYFDRAEEAEQTLTPRDEVQAFFAARSNHIPELEDITGPDQEVRVSDIIQKIVRETVFETDMARDLAAQALLGYAFLAQQLPQQSFLQSATDLGFDAEALAQATGMPLPGICQRLAALPPNTDRPRFGYLKADASGAIVQMLALDGLPVPRYVATSPLWVLYRARQIPGQIVRQRAVFSNSIRVVFVAHAHNVAKPGFAQTPDYVTDMLFMSDEDAAKTAYAPDQSTPLEEIGPAAHLFPDASFDQRAEHPFQAAESRK